GQRRFNEVMAGLETDPRRTTFASVERVALAEAAVLRQGTQTFYKDAFKRMRAFFQHDLASRLTRARALEDIAAQRAAGYQDSTIAADLRCLHRAMVLASQQGLVTIIPKFPNLSAPRRQQTIRPDELAKIIAALPSWWMLYYRVADEVGWRAK